MAVTSLLVSHVVGNATPQMKDKMIDFFRVVSPVHEQEHHRTWLGNTNQGRCDIIRRRKHREPRNGDVTHHQPSTIHTRTRHKEIGKMWKLRMTHRHTHQLKEDHVLLFKLSLGPVELDGWTNIIIVAVTSLLVSHVVGNAAANTHERQNDRCSSCRQPRLETRTSSHMAREHGPRQM